MANSYAGSPGLPESGMPTGALGFVPRRSSYASVVSGSLNGAPYQQPARAGAFSSLLNQSSDLSYDPSYPSMNAHQRYDPRTYDMDFNTNGSSHGRSGSWSRSAQLHPFSSAFAGIMNGNGFGSVAGGSMDQFFIPSYLRGSRYVQKLEEAHKAKVAAHKEGQSAPSSQPGSLSTSASSANLHTKMGASYRGIAHDIIEKAPPAEDETLTPLPSKWNTLDKYGGLEVLNDGQEVKFSGPKSERDRDHEACAIRADYPMPSQCGIYYFEVDILSRKREESSIGIGFSTKNVPLSRLPGWEPESYAYHGDDGHSFCCQSSGKHYGPPFNAGDVVGCGVNFRTGCAFFTKNGDHLGTAFRDIKETKGKLFPSVGMKKAGEHVRINFGQRPFVFDIDGMMSASNSFPYIHSPSLSDPPENGISNQETEAPSAGNPGSPSLAGQTTAWIEEHFSHSDDVPTDIDDETSIEYETPSIEQMIAEDTAPFLQLQGAGRVSIGPETINTLRMIARATEPVLPSQVADVSSDEASQDPILRRAHTTAAQPNSFNGHRELNTLRPVAEELLNPFDSFQEAFGEGQRRQQEALNGSLDDHESRPYITFSILRTRRGYQTTLHTWFQPLASTLRRNLSGSFEETTPTNETVLPDNPDRFTDRWDDTAPLHDARVVESIFTPPTTGMNEMTRSYMEAVMGNSPERRPARTYQDLIMEQRARRGSVRGGRSSSSPSRRQSTSRSPRRPPFSGMPGSSREFPHFPGVPHSRARSRETIVRHQQGVPQLGGAPDSTESSQLRPFLLSSSYASRPASSYDPAIDPPFYEIVAENGERILHRSITPYLRDYAMQLGASPAIVDGTTTLHESSSTRPDQTSSGSLFRQNPPTITAEEFMSAPSASRTEPDNDDHGNGANSVTVLHVRVPQPAILGAPQIGGLLHGQNALPIRQNWTLQEISKRLKILDIRANIPAQREREQIRQEIEATSTAKLSPPMDETDLIQALILQTLTHEGYVETARAFAEEVHAEKKALSLKPEDVVKGFDFEDEDTVNRHRIRTAVLDGDIDKALKHTNAYYPNVLKDNEHVYFRLRCRKFIEMVRQAAKVQNANTRLAKKTNGHQGEYYDDSISHDMELDDHPDPGNYDRMDTEELPEGRNEHDQLLQEILVYGSELQAEFKDDVRREVKKGLEDIFALMAYEDPLNAKGISYLLDPEGRIAVAEELNSAILLSLGKSSSAALEILYQQTYVLLEDLREGGGQGALVNIDDFVRPKPGL